MTRPTWKGTLSFGLVEIPVGLFPATRSRELSFTLLDRRDFSTVWYKRYNKTTGEEVGWDDIVKGYEYEDDQYVVLGDEDFKRANVKATGTIDIEGFVRGEEIDPIFYEAPYYVAPLQRGAKGYALLRETLDRTRRVGIARTVLRTRQHTAALAVHGSALVLHLLRFAHEIRPTKTLDLPGAVKELDVKKVELEMAEKLVEGMATKWDPKRYHDDYRDDLLALVEKKVKSGNTKTIAEPGGTKEGEPRGSRITDVMRLLKQSIEKAEKGKGRGARPSRRSA